MSRSLVLMRGVVGLLLAVVLTAGALADTVDSKALKYHKALVKRPNPGYLFDRFYNSWLDTGTLDELSAYLQKQVEANNATADRLLLAFFYAKQGDDVRALQQFRVALKNDPENAQAFYHKAVVEARTLDFEAAIADLEQARQSKPAAKLATDIAKLQGRLYVRNRQTEKALAVWKQLLDANPNDEDLYEDIIELQISEGLFDEAVALSERLVSHTKDKYKQVIRRIRIGDIHQRAGKRSNALKAYSKTLEDVGHGSWLEREIIAQIEQVFRREDDLTGLQDQYKKLIEQYAKRIEIRKRYAKLLSELGQDEEATKQFEDILRLMPGDRGNHEAYVTLLANTDKLPQAIKAAEALIEQHPEDGELRIRLARLHHQAKDKAAAGKAIDQYLEVTDKSEYVYLRAAQLLKQFEAVEAAEKIYEKLTRAYPESSAALEAQAAFLYTREKKDRALAIWRGLAEGKGRSELVHVARLLAARNEHQTAFDLLQAREQEFSNDTIYLGQLISAAIALEKFEEAIPWARRRVRLAKSGAELETAVAQAAKVIDKADQTSELAQTMSGMPKRSASETCLLAELLERTGDSSGADRVLAEIDDQDSLLVASQQVRLFTQRRDWAKAAEAIRRLVEMPEGRKSIHVRRLVELYQKDFKLDEALRWVQEWKKLSPGSTTPWLTESRLLVRQDKVADAISALRAAVSEFEDDVDLRARLAKLYADEGKLADAERIYWRLYEDGKDLTSKLRWVQQLAEVAELQGTEKQLVEKFEQRRRTNRQSLEPLLSLAEIHRAAGSYEERRKALLEATRIKADDLQLLWHIARIEETEGDWERALATLERALKVDDSPRTREKMARVHLYHGDSEKGYAILYELAGLEQSDARSIEGIAEAMMGVGDWERAEAFLAPQLVRYVDDYRLRYLYSVALEEVGKTSEAIESFVSLLKIDKEIHGRFGKQQQAPWAAYLGPVGALVPQESVDYLELTWISNVVYSYKQGRMGGGYVSGYRGVAQSAISMPNDLVTLRKYTLTHLMTMSQLLDEDEQNDLASSLKTVGSTNAKVLMQLAPQINNPESVLSIAHDHPEDKGVMGLFVLMNMQGSGGEAESCISAYELFKEERPQLALMAAIQAVRMDEDHLKLLDEALKKTDNIEHPNIFPMMSLAYTTNSQFSGGQPVDLPDGYKKRILDRLVDWYPRLKNANIQGYWIFVLVAGALSNGDDPGPYYAFLDGEVKRWRESSQKNQSSSNMMGFYGGPEEQFIQPLGFPPDILPNFPDHVRSILTGDQMRVYGMSGEQNEDWNDKLVLESLQKVKDPTLKILLAQQAGQTGIVEEHLNQMLQSEQPILDALLLAAGKATQDEKLDTAAQLLDKARYLPMSRSVRKRVDRALVALATVGSGNQDAEASQKETTPLASGLQTALSALAKLAGANKKDQQGTEADNALLVAGRGAALRLRRALLNVEERQQLVVALEELGLKDEADKLEETATALAGSSGPVRSVGASSSYGTQTNRVTQLLNDGKQEQAIRVIVGQFKILSQSVLSQPGYLRYNEYELRELKTTIQAHGLQKDVLAKLDPGDSSSELKWSHYGIACEVLGEPDKARQAYEKVLAKRKKNDSIRYQLIGLIVQTEPEAADALLLEISPRNAPSMASAMIGMVSDSDTELVKRIQVFELLTRYLASHIDKDTEKIDLSWAMQLAGSLSGEQYMRHGNNLSSLYAISPPEGNYSEEVSALIEKRAKAHRTLCETMLKIPQLAPDGFTQLLALAEREDKVTDKYIDMALQAVLDHQPARGAASAQPTVSPYLHLLGGHSSSDTETVPFRTPSEFLVRHAWKTKNLKLVTEQAIPKLEAAEKTKLADQFRESLTLYTCEEDVFLKTVQKSMARERSQRGRYRGQYVDLQSLSKAIEIWEDRELGVGLQPLFEEQLKRNADNSIAAPTTRYLLALARQAKHEQVIQFLDMLAEEFIGPREERSALVEKHYKPNQWSSNTVNGRIHQFTGIIQALFPHRELAFPALEQLRLCGLEQIGLQARYQLMQHFSNLPTGGKDPQKDIDLIFAFIESSPFLADLDELYVYASDEDNEAETLLGHMLFALQDRSISEGVRKKLEARDPQTFGTGLLIAATNSDAPLTKTVLEYLTQQREAIESQPADKQRMIAKLLEQLDARQPVRDMKLSDEQKQTREWLLSARSDRHKALTERILKAKRFSDLQKDGNNFTNNLDDIIGRTIDSDPERALELFEKVIQLVEKSPPARHRRRQQGTSYAAQLLREISNSRYDFATTAFTIDVLLADRQEDFDSSWLESSIRRTVRNRYWQSLPNSSNEETPIQRMKLLYAELGKHLGTRPTTILAGAYVNLFNELSEEQFTATMSWLEKEAKDGEFPEIAQELLAAARLVAATNAAVQKDQQAKSEQPKAASSSPQRLALEDYHRHYLAVLDDDKLPLTWRLFVARNLAVSQPQRLPTEALWACAATLQEAYESKALILEELSSTVASAMLALPHDDAWKESAGAFAASWNRYYLRGQARTSGYYSSSDDSETAYAMLALNIELGNKSEANKVFRQYQNHLGYDRRAFFLLVRNGYHGQAAKVLRMGGDHLVNASDTSSSGPFDRELEALMPSFLEALKRDDERLFARVLLVTLEDSADEEQRVATDRAARIQEVAAELNKLESIRPAINEMILCVLGADEHGGAAVAEALAAAAEKIDLSAAIDLDEHYLRERKKKVVRNFLTMAFRRGDFESVLPVVRGISEVETNNDYERERVLSMIIRDLYFVAGQRWADWSPEEFAGMAPITRILANPSNETYYYDHGSENDYNQYRLTSLNIAVHVLGDRIDDLVAWRNELSTGQQQKLMQLFVAETLWRYVANAVGKPSEENLDRRVALATGVLKTAEHLPWIGTNNGRQIFQRDGKQWNFVASMNQVGLLTKEEFVAHGPEIATAAPIGGLLWAVVAQAQTEAQQNEAAVESWAKALETAPEKDKVRQTVWRIYRASMLSDLKRHDEAIATLDSLDKELIHEPNQGAFRSWREQVEKRAQSD